MPQTRALLPQALRTAGLLLLLFALPAAAEYADHPRIYLTPARIARIQTQHWQGDSYEWGKLMTCAARSDMDGVRAQALAYAITGDEVWAETAVAILLDEMIDHPTMSVTFNSTGSQFHIWGLAFDWLYNSPSFTPAIKQQVIDYVNAVPKDGSGKWNWYPQDTYFNGVCKIMWGPPIWGLATHGDNPDADIYVDNGYVDRWSYVRNAYGYGPDNLAVTRGGCLPMGMDYGSGTLAFILRYVDAVWTATGQDLYEEAPALKQFLEFMVKSYYYTEDFIRRPEHGHNAHKMGGYLDNAITALIIAMDRYRDEPEGQWAAWWYDNIEGAQYYPGNGYRYFSVYDVIYSDATIPRLNPNTEPLAYFAEGNGMWICRSGWTSGTTEPMTFATFRSGNWTWFNQNQWDQGNYCIYSHGEDLLVDGGVYDGDGGSHVRNYHAQTIAHNCITVKDPGQTKGWYFYAWSDPDYENSGGQNVPYRETVGGPILDGVPKDVNWQNYQGYYLHDMSDILRRTHNDRYTYAFADMTNSYANTRWETDYDPGKLNEADYSPKVDNVTRHWMYLRSDTRDGAEYFVTYDRVSSLDASFQKKNLLHFIGEPVFSNGALDNEEVPGHIDTWAADRFEMELGGATLHGAVVLPADPLVRRVGGEGYQWWVNGTNYDAVPDPTELGGMWRLEIMPPTASEDDLFLNVLQPDYLGGAAPDVRRISAATGEGASFGDWVVMFSNEESIITDVLYASTLVGEQRHLVFDAQPSFEYNVYRNSDPTAIATVLVGNDGIVEFVAADGGNFQVTQGAFVPDTTPPNGSIRIQGGNCVGGNPVTLHCDVADSQSGMGGGQMKFSNDGVTWSPDQPFDDSAVWSLAAGDGQKTVHALFADSEGNWMASPLTDATTVDSTPPDATFDVIEETVAAPTVTLSNSAFDVGCAGAAITMAFSNNGISWSAGEPFDVTKSWDLASADEGLHTVFARFGDANGNWSDTMTDEVFLDLPGVDQIPPQYSEMLPPENAFAVGIDTPMAVMVTDSHSGLNADSLAFFLGGAPLAFETRSFVGGAKFLVADSAAPLDPLTPYTLRARAADLADPPNGVDKVWIFITGSVAGSFDAPGAPSGLQVAVDEQCNVDIGWTENQEPTTLGYQPGYGTWPDGEAIEFEFQRTIGARLEEIDDGVYWFGIRAIDGNGKLSEWTKTGESVELDCQSPVDPSNEDPWDAPQEQGRVWERGEIWPPGVLADAPDTPLSVHNLPNGWAVRVFTVSGKLVRDHRSRADGETFIWDSRNANGNAVARGVYLVRVYNRSGRAEREGRYLRR